jgi:hypothetical protein
VLWRMALCAQEYSQLMVNAMLRLHSSVIVRIL